jgi:hypothetical protein
MPFQVFFGRCVRFEGGKFCFLDWLGQVSVSLSAPLVWNLPVKVFSVFPWLLLDLHWTECLYSGICATKLLLGVGVLRRFEDQGDTQWSPTSLASLFSQSVCQLLKSFALSKAGPLSGCSVQGDWVGRVYSCLPFLHGSHSTVNCHCSHWFRLSLGGPWLLDRTWSAVHYPCTGST